MTTRAFIMLSMVVPWQEAAHQSSATPASDDAEFENDEQVAQAEHPAAATAPAEITTPVIVFVDDISYIRRRKGNLVGSRLTLKTNAIRIPVTETMDVVQQKIGVA